MPILTTVLLIASFATLTPEPMRLTVDPARAGEPDVVATLDAAIKAGAAAPAGTPSVEIQVAPGVYEVRTPLRIGKLGTPLTIRGTGAGVRLIGGMMVRSGGVPIAQNDPNRSRFPAEAIAKVVCLDLAKAKTGGGELSGPARHGMNLPAAAGSELFVNGHPLTLARWPNTGFAPIDGVVDAGTSKERLKPNEPLRGGTFRVKEADRLARWATAKDVWLAGYWFNDWADDQLPAGKIDAAAGTITLGLPHTYGLGKAARYAVINLPEELDAPGEYWIDVAGGRAYVWPPENAGGGTQEYVVSLLREPMLTLDGAADVTLEGLTFESGRGPAVHATGVEKIHIQKCAFRNTGVSGVDLDGRHSTIEACTFDETGSSGVSLTGGDRATLTHADNRVQDCTFRRCGRTHRTYQPAIRLDGVGQIVANNLIEELPHSAIIFAGNEHVIELNDIGRVLLETGDCGAIYCGRDWTLHGTVIRHNLFHDMRGTDARYQNAVYLDDMASGIAVEGNIFVKCPWGMLIGGGRDIQIRGNVLISCSKGMSFDKRGVGWMAKNIADPAKSTLHERLRAVPIDREPWKSRYPTLSAYLTDRFGRPANGLVAGNVLMATPLGSIVDRECVKVENNTESKQALEADLLAAIMDPAKRAGLQPFIPAGAPSGFAPIPVAKIGPRVH